MFAATNLDQRVQDRPKYELYSRETECCSICRYRVTVRRRTVWKPWVM